MSAPLGLITGGLSGIGAATAVEFARLGARMMLLDIRRGEDEIEGSGPGCWRSRDHDRVRCFARGGPSMPRSIPPSQISGVSTSLSRIPGYLDAEKCAVAFDLEREFVLHDNGVATSPLRQLARNYAAANNAVAVYPTYVLVDRTGVIRSFHQGYSLPNLQSELAGFTGVALNADWSADSGITALPTYGGSDALKGLHCDRAGASAGHHFHYGLVEETASASFGL